MPKSGLNVALKGLDDLFSSEETRQEEQREQVQQIPVDELFPFKNHPFKVLDDDAMTRTVESISQFGVLAPLIARPRPEGGYEIISGHRRKHAAELAHLDTVPVIVRNMEDDAATILMVDSNLQREHILPSERAFAYKMKLDAIKNQGARSDLTSSQVGTKLRADEKVAKDSGESRNQVHSRLHLRTRFPVCTRWICLLAFPAVQDYGLPYTCEAKTPRNTDTAWSTALLGGVLPRTLSLFRLRSSRTISF